MALGFSAAEANTILDTQLADFDFVQLHTADPGAAGTTAIAGNNTRKAIVWNAASGGSATNNGAVSWSDAEVDTLETYTHVSFWTLASGGDFLMSGAITANQVQASGDSFQINDAAYTISLSVAA